MRRKTERRLARDYAKLIKGGQKGPGGEHILGSSQLEAIATLRALDIPPSPHGSPDAVDPERDRVDEVVYRRAKNARKRARRARGAR